MGQKLNRNIELLLMKYRKYTKESARKVVNELRSSSQSFGELRRNFNKLKADTFYYLRGESKYKSLFDDIEGLIEKEINNTEIK